LTPITAKLIFTFTRVVASKYVVNFMEARNSRTLQRVAYTSINIRG